MKVLYVNHTATIGGGERSLLELLSGLPDDVSPALACPEGELASAGRSLGLPLTTIPEVSPSFRLHLFHTARGLAHFGRAALAVRHVARSERTDVVHANSVRAGLIAAPLARLGGPPVIVHVRDCLPSGMAADLTRRAIGSAAALVLANSSYTATRFVVNGTRAPVRTVYNSVDLEAFDPAHIDRDEARSRLGLEPGEISLGVIAQITPWKAQDDAIRILSALRRRVRNVRLLIVGEAKFAQGSETLDNAAFERSLYTLVSNLRLSGVVNFLGERADVPEILCALDLLLVPSWEEPFGRSVIEAMAMETLVIATNVGGPAEIITDGADGLLLPPRQPERWADVAARIVAAPKELREMGKAGRQTVVARFDRAAHVDSVLTAYRDALESTG